MTFKRLALLLAFVLMAQTANQVITRGYIYSEVGTLFTWSGSAPSWSGSNQAATYSDFTTYVANTGSCGGSSSELITYSVATGCAVNVFTTSGNGESSSSSTCTYRPEDDEWSCDYSGLETFILTSTYAARAASASTPVSGSYTLASDSTGVTSVILASSGGGSESLSTANGTHSFGPYTSGLSAGTLTLTVNVTDDPSCSSPPLLPSDCSYASLGDVSAASITAYH